MKVGGFAHDVAMSTQPAQSPLQSPEAIGSRIHFASEVHLLTDAARAYYDGETVTMTDAEYDERLDALREEAAANPQYFEAAPGSGGTAGEPTPGEALRAAVDGLLGKVAAGQSAGGDVVHPVAMLSLAKVTAGDDDAWRTIEGLVAACAHGVVVEPKMDGLAIRVEYVAGRLTLAATRGDGLTGEDVTDRVLRGQGVAGLPAVLDSTWTGEVRGEVYMSAEQFDVAQTLRAERGGKPFVNPRNATAGALRKSGEDHWMPLSFAAYDMSTGTGTDDALAEASHAGLMATASTLGFTTVKDLAEAAGVTGGPYVRHEDVRQAVETIEAARPGLGFDIDGAVVKADRATDRTQIGAGSRTPKWAVAYKYPAEEASAVVEDIEVTVGRTGRIGLRARITPTFVGGTTVTYATLHNPQWVLDQGIGIGSKVVLKRAGDVIPRITAPLGEQSDVPTWTPPQTCPKCGEPWNKDSLLWRCETPSCGLVNAIDYWAARDCMDIEGLGGSVAEALVAADLVSATGGVADLYALTVEQLAALPMGLTATGGVRTLGVANATKIAANIEGSKSQPFNRVITGLGIRMTGRSVGRWLARDFGDMASLRAASVERLAQIEKLGQIKAQAIVNGLVKMSDVIDRLTVAGVNMGEALPTAGADDQVAGGAGQPLSGKSVVISGAVPGYTRTTGAEAIEAAGGKASSSVSKTTSYLVTAETETSKAKKAASLGVPIIDPAQFDALLRGEIG